MRALGGTEHTSMNFRLVTIVVIALSVLGCDQHGAGMFTIDDPRLQEELITAVNEAGISTTIDSRGQLRFDHRYQDTVNQIAFHVLDTSKSGGSAVRDLRWPDPKYTQLFVEKLEAAGIEFETGEMNGELTVHLDRDNNARSQSIQELVDDLYVSEKAKELGIEGY